MSSGLVSKPFIPAAVQRAGWPDARVLALRAPGTDPVALDVHARQAADGDPADTLNAPHWEV